jgi:hypothetical protein
MAIKTFTTGEVLTAADTNTYLANSGLVYVKGQSIGAGVTAQVVSNCFNNTYDAYRVVISNVTMSNTSSGANMWLKMHDGTNPNSSAAYNWGIAVVDLANGAYSGYAGRLLTTGMLVGTGTGDKFGTTFDVTNPYIASHTIFGGLTISQDSGGYAGSGAGMHQLSTSYSGLQIAPSTGTITGGTIIVYGYRYGTT